MDGQSIFKIVVLLYSVSNLLSLGIELNLKETLKALRSNRLIVLTLLSFLLSNTIPTLTAAHYLGREESKVVV
jgi:hypothetical protein